MAQGLDLKSWKSEKSPSMDSKHGESVKKGRGVGSRRIFPPQFKLQVLDSYRNDVDCRGNQRATARKYNIHRRQIQKWLQCEQNLRTTVEESARNESKPRKKSDSEEDKTESTLNQSATAIARLGDAGRPKENKSETKADSTEDPKLEAQNLKRVAQKLYPSLQGIPCAQEEKVTDGQEFYGGDVAYGARLAPPGPEDARDDNFNKVIRTDEDGPLDLKSKVRSETLPEEFLENGLPDKGPGKLSMGREGSGPPSENIGGQKLSALGCLAQKYADDVGGREFYARDADKGELLCSQTDDRTESSSLVAEKCHSVPHVAPKRALEEGKEAADVASDLNLATDGYGPDTCRKKAKAEILSRFDSSKSFSPKRKWMKESLQEMLEDAEQSQETPSLPIKQRVKMNLRSLPEATYASDDLSRPSGISSNFTIERLCSNDATKENYCHDRRPASSDCYRPVPEVVSFHFPSEIYHHDSGGSDRLTPIDRFDVPLKEERISEGEDMDVDILSTTPVEKKTFDFSSYNFGKRRSFSVQFKLTVLDAFYNDKDCNKNQRATARKFNINRRQVQKWLSQENDLRSEGSMKNGKYLQRQRLGAEPREAEGCTKCPQHCLRKRELEDAFEKTIEVNVKHCSDNECLSRRDKYGPENPKTKLTGAGDFYGKTLFQSDLKCANFYHNYLFPESNNLIYHDSILGWPNFSTSALAVPNFQYLSTWHHNFDFCPENQKIY